MSGPVDFEEPIPVAVFDVLVVSVLVLVVIVPVVDMVNVAFAVVYAIAVIVAESTL